MILERFQMISEVLSFNKEAQTLEAIAHVPQESPVFEGHFPGFPLLPGVLMIEAMAQTSGWLIMGLNGFTAMPFLAGVKEAKMRTFITPSQTLHVKAELVHLGSGYAMTKAKITCEGKPASQTELTFKVTTFPRDDLKTMITDWAKKLNFPFGE